MRTVLYRYQGSSTFRPINGGALLTLNVTPEPEPPYSPYTEELGVVGNRPSLAVRPDASNTGPRSEPLQTMSATQALASIMSAPLEADGYRYLRRTQVSGQLTLSTPEHHNLRFEDCVFTGNGYYIINAFYGTEGDIQPAGDWVEFRFCEMRGGKAATTTGGYVRYLRCNIHRGTDLSKPRRESEYYACWMHDTWHDVGAHCDVVQIVSGSADCLFHWNNMIGFNAPDSPSAPGGYSNGVLQTGSASRDIGPVQWHNNWFDGGGYTIRVGSSSDRNGFDVDYTFTNNRFGRNFRYCATYGSLATINFDASNVWDDTGLPV